MMMTMTLHLRVVCEEEWSPERKENGFHRRRPALFTRLPLGRARGRRARAEHGVVAELAEYRIRTVTS